MFVLPTIALGVIATFPRLIIDSIGVNSESNILSSTPTNPSGEVTINLATDTNNLYIYDGEDWYIYDDIFITDATSTEAEILASTPTNPTDLVTVKHATDTNDLYVYYNNGWHIYFND